MKTFLQINTAAPGTTYSVLFLLTLSILGILAHVLSDITKGKQNKTFTDLSTYLKTTWDAIALSFVICLVIIMVRHEFMQIPDFSKWEGLGMATIGFVGRSVLIPLFAYLNKLGIKVDGEDVAKAILVLIFIGAASCSTQKHQISKARQTFNKYPDSFATNCSNAFPIKEKIIQSTTTKKGLPVYIPGKTKYVTVDCDSAVKSLKTELERKTVQVKIPKSSSGYTVRVDTVFKDKIVVEENTAEIKSLQATITSQITEMTRQSVVNGYVTASYKKWKHRAIGGGVIVLAVTCIWIAIKKVV